LRTGLLFWSVITVNCTVLDDFSPAEANAAPSTISSTKVDQRFISGLSIYCKQTVVACHLWQAGALAACYPRGFAPMPAKLKTLALATLIAVPLSVTSQTQPSPPARAPEISARARAIHNSAIVIDTHADTTQRLLDENFDLASITPISEGHWDLSKAHAGNLGAEFFSIWVEPKFTGQYARRAHDLIDSVYEQAARHPDQMVMAFSAEEIRRARRGSRLRVAALLGIEGGHAIENDIRELREFYRLGVRYMTLTWSNTNEWADSSGDIDDPAVKHHNGLSDFGREVVREMNRLGMMVDISHVSDKTFWDVIEVSRSPVIASHSSARALSNHPRNMTDDMLRAVTKNGGVVMVNFFSAFVDEDFRRQ